MGRIKKIVFLIESCYNKRDHERFGIDILIRNGFDVEVWDFTSILASSKFGKVRPPDPIKWNKWTLFETKKQAVDALLSLDRSVYIVSLVRCYSKTFYLYKAIKNKMTPYCVLGDSTPKSSRQEEAVVKQIKNFTFRKLLRKITEIKPLKYYSVMAPDIIMAMGERYFANTYPVRKETEVVWSHSFDYDIYMKMKGSAGIANPKVWVFLDVYFPFHPDFINYGLSLNADPDEYHLSLRRFFDHIQSAFGVRSIIAAHPRSHYEKHGDCFGGREIVRGRTAQLVRESDLVIMHNSLAINYAVLFKKPIIFVTTNQYNASQVYEEPSVKWLAGYFGKRVHNLDDPINVKLEEEMKVNEPAYSKYRNDHIKKEGSAELPFWQILADRLKLK